MKFSNARFYGFCFSLVILATAVLWFRRDHLPEAIPIFQTIGGEVLRTCPKSAWTMARLPLMHLLFLVLIILASGALPEGTDGSRIARAAVLAASLKGFFEILALALGTGLLGYGALAVILIFLVLLVRFFARRNWSFQFQTVPLASSSQVLIGAGLVAYGVLVAMPLWFKG